MSSYLYYKGKLYNAYETATLAESEVKKLTELKNNYKNVCGYVYQDYKPKCKNNVLPGAKEQLIQAIRFKTNDIAFLKAKIQKTFPIEQKKK